MELLVVTLAQVSPQREADALARMRVISDTVRNAPGLLNARFYRSREPGTSYCMLTTWESVEWWQKAQERHAPATLLLSSPPDIFHIPPDQWLMQYLWGYSRPLAQPTIATARLALVRPEMVEHVQQEWLESLRQQAVEPVLSFALLARSLTEDPLSTSSSPQHYPLKQGTMFFNLLSWPGERYREDFYTNEHAQSVQGLLNRTAMVHSLTLDPM
jgi:quinol monooxygenase YgiN